EILARVYLSAVSVFRQTGRNDDALRAALRAYELAERTTRDRPGDLSAARTRLYATTAAVDRLVQAKGHADRARRVCEQGIAFGKARVREHPRDIEMRLHLAHLEFDLGYLEKTKGHPGDALKIVRSAADTLGALARENPLMIEPRSNWGIALHQLSQLQTDL